MKVLNKLVARQRLFACCLLVISMLCLSAYPIKSVAEDAGAGYFTVDSKEPGVWAFNRQGKLVTQLLAQSGSKPVLWPVIGPYDIPLTRAYPVAATEPGEKEDHIHHRSLWFTHGEVNGIDFWAEGEGRGRIEQTTAKVLSTGERAVMTTENVWRAPDGQPILSDTRTITVHDDHGMTAIDIDLVLNASHGPVVFGDTKEGSFGVRVAGTMSVDSKLGGSIVNSRGEVDDAAWGKQAEWVDYYGPVSDKTVGIAILNHPDSFAFPTRWHVRTYGLFAANPFGVHHFVGGDATEGVKLAAGEKLSLRYRLLLHSGATDEAKIGEAWERYRSTP
jgi:hypothetical protein